MNKYNQLGRVRYNQLGRMKYNSQETEYKPLYNRLALSRPVILDQNRRRLAVLENADDIILEQEVNGIDQLTFTLPWKDKKRKYIQNENLVQLVDRLYIIRRVSIKRSGLSPAEIEVYAEALWYDLQFAEPVTKSRWEEATPAEIMADLLAGTGWFVGNVTITRRRTLEVEEGITNRLEALAELPSLFSGELKFNSSNMTVDFTEPVGRKSGAAIVYSKNLEEIEAIYDTEELVTRIYLYGKDNMSIADANDGVPYLEDFSYTNKVRVRVIKDERFTNPYYLKEKGQDALKVLARPRASYIMKASDLSSLSGLSHEEFFLGDEVLVFDEELGINVTTRIMSWKYNVKEPWNTELQLETKQPSLTELLTGIQDSASFLQSEDTVDRSEMLNLHVFNYLMNSRADDGFNYWTNDGWEIDPVNGYSGNASFKATAQPGVKKSLKQTVYPSHRDSYSISMRVATENLQVGTGKVGVYIRIKYTDGTEDEPIWISLAEEV
ncbi:phage tail protein [Anoxybacillus sp. FSL W8-1294]|uniref:phage tail protein n=1 Tax=Anoxybacillus sp. FSL W8-1294 TaxID=2954655 RepID=UPI0030CF32D5